MAVLHRGGLIAVLIVLRGRQRRPCIRPGLAQFARKNHHHLGRGAVGPPAAAFFAGQRFGAHELPAARRLGISERTLRYKLAAIAGRPRMSGRSAGAMVLQ